MKEKLALLPRILEGQSIVLAKQSIIANIIIQLMRPHAPSSTTSERNSHHQKMKNEVIERYQLVDPNNSSQIKCMVTGRYFQRDDVHCSHIIDVRSRQSLAVIGLKDEDIWSPRNGLGLFKEIEKFFDDLEAVSIVSY